MELLPNSKFHKGQRIVAIEDIKLHFGGWIKKGDEGTVIKTEVVGTGKWTIVDMDAGFRMSFSRENQIDSLTS